MVSNVVIIYILKNYFWKFLIDMICNDFEYMFMYESKFIINFFCIEVFYFF